MPIVIETMQEFDARHTVNGPKLRDTESHCELFPDGAMRTRFGEQLEPPQEPGALLRAKRAHVALNLRLQELAWTSFKADCSERLANKARYGFSSQPGPPLDAVAQLKNGAERIRKLRGELDVLDREISKLPGEVARRAASEQRRADQQSARQQLSDIAGMTI